MYEPLSPTDSDPRSLPTAETADELHALHEEPAERPAPSSLLQFLLKLLVLLGLICATPYLVERVQYSITRGRQRAEYETAIEGLNRTSLRELSLASQMIAQKVGPSVVHINVSSFSSDGLGEANGVLPRRGFRPQGQGSGVIVDRAGYIVTNGHVVANSRDIRVSLSYGQSVPAAVVGIDELTDLAVLKIEGDDLVAAEWGDSDDLLVGAMVWALGSPFGLDRSITFGILSAKHRSEKAGLPHQDFLQTDAAVNPGNSGGPLVDANGRIVGINTAIIGEAYQGISFSIPSNVARDIYQQLIKEKRVLRGWLGVRLGNVSEELASQLGLKDTRGAHVLGFVNQDLPSPARDAGMARDDVILKWNGRRINNDAELKQLVAKTPIGSTADVLIFREGQEQTLSVTIGERPFRTQ